MRLLLVAGAIVPHAPLLLGEVAGPSVARRLETVTKGFGSYRFPDVDALVIASPHGPSTGVYAGRRGDLDAFGCPGIMVEAPAAADLAGEVGRTWHAPTLGAHLDHGIVVPLLLGILPSVPVVATVVTDASEGKALADAVAEVAEKRKTRIAFVASANTSVALTERAPLGLKDDAVEIEKRFIQRLQMDSAVAETDVAELADVGGSCGSGPLTAFGHLFPGRGAQVIAYDHPFGVGYLFALVA